MESFDGKFRDSCLEHWFKDLADVKLAVNDLASPLQPMPMSDCVDRRARDAAQVSETSRLTWHSIFIAN